MHPVGLAHHEAIGEFDHFDSRCLLWPVAVEPVRDGCHSREGAGCDVADEVTVQASPGGKEFGLTGMVCGQISEQLLVCAFVHSHCHADESLAAPGIERKQRPAIVPLAGRQQAQVPLPVGQRRNIHAVGRRAVVQEQHVPIAPALRAPDRLMPSGQPTLLGPEAPVRNESLEPPRDSGPIGVRVSSFDPACQVENAVEDIKGMLGLLAGPLQQGDFWCCLLAIW